MTDRPCSEGSGLLLPALLFFTMNEQQTDEEGGGDLVPYPYLTEPYRPMPRGLTNEEGQVICGSRVRGRPGEICQRTDLNVENGRCPLHGGKMISGPAHGRFRRGIYARTLPTRLMDAFDRALSDPELLSLRSDIAYVDTQIGDLIARYESGGGPTAWEEMREGLSTLLHYLSIGIGQREPRSGQVVTEATLRVVANNIARCLEDSQRGVETAREIRETILLRQRLIEGDTRHRIQEKQMIAAEEVITLTAAIVDTFARVVNNDAALIRSFSAAIEGLISDGGHTTLEGES